MRFAILLALLSALPGFGATISGIVKDSSGATVAQAAVTLGVSSTSTDPHGRFEFTGIPSGQYRIAVTHDGFEPFSRTVTAPSDPIIIILQVAATKTSVEVSGRRSALRNSDPNYLALRGGSLRNVYRVKDLMLVRDAGIFTFRSGSFSFLPAVLGHVTAGVFIGDGNFRLKPAAEISANHLRQISGASTVDEDFSSLVVYFTDATFDEIAAHAEVADDSPKGHQDVLHQLQEALRRRADTPTTYLQRLMDADDVPNMEAELLAELYNQTGGSFRAFIHGRKHSGLRFLLNPQGAIPQLPAPEEVALLNYDWTSDADGIWYLSHTIAELRSGSANSAEEKRLVAPEHYRIETAIDGDQRLSVACDLQFHPLRDHVRAIKFDLLPDMQVSRVTLDGREIPFLQENRNHDGSFYLVLPQPLAKDHAYDVSFEYQGSDLIRQTHIGYNSENSRTLFLILPTQPWYPRVGGVSRATFDMTFHVPHGMTVIATGDRVKSGTEDGKDFTQWVSKISLPVAGFNYGYFARKQRTDESNGFRLEAWLGSSGKSFFMPDSVIGLNQAENAVRIFEHWYGAPIYNHLAVTESSYQGSIPGIVFASALSMNDASTRYGAIEGRTGYRDDSMTGADSRYDTAARLPPGVPQPPQAEKPVTLAVAGSDRALPRIAGAMFDESLPREVSRQWWGALINPASFHEEWLIRGLIDFSGSIYDMSAESDTGDFLQHWSKARDLLLAKTYWGVRRTDAAPLWLGSMAEPMLTQRSFHALFVAPTTVLTGMKGGYVFHMLRRLMFDPSTGDKDFIAMMHDFTSTFAHQTVNTEQFKAIVEKHMKQPMDWFFNEWVYGTELPSYSLEYSLDKNVLRGKLTQNGVSERFRMRVPVYLKFGTKMIAIGPFTLTGNQTHEFRAELPEAPKSVLLNVNYDILCDKAEVKQVR